MIHLSTPGEYLKVNGKWSIPTYVYVGMKVIAAYKHQGEWTGLKCLVDIAAGKSCRVVNNRYGFAEWFRLDELRVEN